ncbi:tudor domain-containing protein 7B-like, partial [Tropilaelaps mercedesae]
MTHGGWGQSRGQVHNVFESAPPHAAVDRLSPNPDRERVPPRRENDELTIGAPLTNEIMHYPQNPAVSSLRSAASTLSEAASKMEGVDLANNLRNLLRSAKGGIPLKRLDEEFYTFAGVHIPLGAFRNLEELLKTLPDVCTLRTNDRGHIAVYGTKSRGHQTATVLGGHSKAASSSDRSGAAGGHSGGAGGSSKRPPPGGRGGRGLHPQAPQNNTPHYTP